MTLALGTTLAGYRIESLLGRGGMGEVYLATHEGLGRKVALKLLAPELAADPGFRQRFIAESRLAASLDHPHIVPIYEAGEAAGRLFLAMRYVEGADLGALIARDGPLEPTRAIGLLGGIADALDAAHERGLVHRDVKPANILVARTSRADEHAYLGDFGLTKQLGSDAGFTRSGQLVGSVDFMAPEQIEGRPIDGRVDVYSLACVLYTALAGRPPYPRETEMATLWAHVQADPPRLSDLRPELASYDPVIARGMAKDPAKRYADGRELLSATTAAAHGNGALGDVAQPGTAVDEPRLGRMSIDCPSCGARNDPGARSCSECGLQLPQVPSTAPSEERKVVSVLFCDLVALQPDADAADPEDARARIEPYHERIRTDVERFGGTFERLAGDGFLAVFGAPTTHEDDSERAVRAGLRILETLDDLNHEDPSLAIRARIGIATGEALVTQGARPEWGERIVTGHVVNAASRLPSDADIGAVVVAEDTYRATRDVFDYQPLEARSREGLVEPVQTWWAKGARSRFGSDIVRTHGTPLVGRELERTLLQGVYERAVRDSSVQLVTIVGEPGIGKTRLVAELGSYIDAKVEFVRWRQGRCLPYGEGITFWALGEIVKAEAGILDSDSMALAAEKLDLAVPADEPDREWLKARLAPLVGAQSGPPAEREEAFTAWRRFLEGMVATGPAVLVFEDLHWADDALLGFLEYLADWSEGAPLLLVCTARPELYERRKDWAGGKRNTTTITLPPLSDEETTRLVSALLDGADLPARTQQTVLERAGGNPLYAEEFVRLVRDHGSVDQVGQRVDGEVPLPASLQALIAARLDTLPAERKAMLQDASVVGKVFWASTLATMGGRDVAEVRVALHELSRKELVRSSRVSSMEGEAEYAFWHALVRDVAYGQIPRAARAAKHRTAAAWIEEKAGERVEDLADVLAYHYGMALELTQAGGKNTVAAELTRPVRRFLVLAGERALALDVGQAAAHFAKALALAPRDDPSRSSILVRWADAVRQVGQVEEAAGALEEAIADLRGRGDVLATGRALSLLSNTLTHMDAGRSTQLAIEAVRLLESVQPSGELVEAYAEVAGDEWIRGAARKAIDWAQRALGLARDLGLPEPARALGFLGSARCDLGDAGGLEDMDRALRLAIDQGHGREAAVLYVNIPVSLIQIEGPAAALRIQRAGIEFAERRGISELALGITAGSLESLLALGRWDEVLAIAASLGDHQPELSDRWGMLDVMTIEARIRLDRGETELVAHRLEGLEGKARAIGNPQGATSAFAVAGLAHLVQGRRDRAAGLLAELERLPNLRTTPTFVSWLPDLVRLSIDCDRLDLAEWLVTGVKPLNAQHQHALGTARAALFEARGDLAGAAVVYAEAAAGWHVFGNVPERARTLLGQGRCLLELGRSDAAVPLKQARAIFKALGASPLVANTDALLARAIASGEPTGRKHGQKAATDST